MGSLSHEALSIGLGAKLVLDVEGLGAKLHSIFVGSVRGRLVIIQLPLPTEISKELMYQHLSPRSPLVVRYLSQGTVVGFRCQVVQYQHAPYPLLFLTYPEATESYNLRRHPRINCLFRGAMRHGDMRCEGVVTDISLGGCCFISDPLTTTPALPRLEDHLDLFCDPLGATAATPFVSEIRRVAMRDGRLELGLKYLALSEPQVTSLNSYINDAICLL